ncbi:MAG: branched-chain amino acid transport system permease protein [Celeribacter sp.]|jgi:branched-chain amino acid transport system permease protein
MSIEVVTFSLLNGTLYGMLLFLLASGLTLIFSMMGVLNFAHASFFMIGAYFGFEISQVIGFFPALILAPILVGLLGAFVERFGLRRVHKFGHLGELLFTFGLAFVIEEAVQMIWGRSPMDYQVPAALDFTAFEIFGTGYPAFRLFMLVMSIAIFAALALLLTRTRVGLIVKASLTHPEMVSMLGHDVPLVFMSVFGVGSALAGVAGVIGGPILITQPSMAASLGPILFVIVVVGGLGSLSGAFIASLLIGFIQTFAVAIDLSVADVFALMGVHEPPAAFGPLLSDIWTVTVSQVGPVIPYILLVAMLIFRPMGLIGKRA